MGEGKKIERKKTERKRIRDLDIVPGVMKTGPKNKITDVPGVLVGHKTVRGGDSRTGVTVIIPEPGNVFNHKFIAAGYVHNGFDKICGLIQVKELETLETPIALANTLNIGLAAGTLAEYAIKQYAKEQMEATSVGLVMGEYNDCKINRIQRRTVSMEDVMGAFSRADENLEEGDVGASTGTVRYGLKGGIGFASKIMRIGGKKHTLRVLVQSNFGATEDLVINGIRADERILEEEKRHREMVAAEQDQGSIMTIVTMDLPVNDRQLKCVIRRAGVGIAGAGTYTGYGSGKMMTGFTTAGRLRGKDSPETMINTRIREGLINMAFKAAAEAVHEAILDSMTIAGRTGGLAGEVYYNLSEFLPQILKH